MKKLSDTKKPMKMAGYGFTRGEKHKHLKTAMRYGVISKGRDEKLDKNQYVIVVDKDNDTNCYKGAIAKGKGLLSKYDANRFWPLWNPGNRKPIVHRVKFLTKAFKLPDKIVQSRILTMSNIRESAKALIYDYLKKRQRRYMSIHERRKAPDNNFYTKLEFKEYFGNLDEWKTSANTSKLVL